MERIGADVQRELARFGPQAGMASLVEAWPAVVGEAIARNAWPARIGRDGTIHVATSSAAWAFELAQLEHVLLGRLREAVSDLALPHMRFAVGRLPEPALLESEPVEKRRIAPANADRQLAERFAAGIEDEELRDAVARAAAQSLARARSGR